MQTCKFIINNYNMLTLIICTFINFKINRIMKFHYIVLILTYIIIKISIKIQVFELLNEKITFFNYISRYSILKQKTTF